MQQQTQKNCWYVHWLRNQVKSVLHKRHVSRHEFDGGKNTNNTVLIIRHIFGGGNITWSDDLNWDVTKLLTLGLRNLAMFDWKAWKQQRQWPKQNNMPLSLKIRFWTAPLRCPRGTLVSAAPNHEQQHIYYCKEKYAIEFDIFSRLWIKTVD